MDLDRLFNFLAENDPAAAGVAAEVIIAAIQILARHPYSGSPVRGSLRELVISVREAILEATSGACSEEPLAHGYKELSIPPAASGEFRMEPHALHIWPRGWVHADRPARISTEVLR